MLRRILKFVMHSSLGEWAGDQIIGSSLLLGLWHVISQDRIKKADASLLARRLHVIEVKRGRVYVRRLGIRIHRGSWKGKRSGGFVSQREVRGVVTIELDRKGREMKVSQGRVVRVD